MGWFLRLSNTGSIINDDFQSNIFQLKLYKRLADSAKLDNKKKIFNEYDFANPD